MNKEELQIVKEWIDKANEDLRLAEYILNSRTDFNKPACFHLQQAAEKYLKAFLAYHKIEIIKTHNIEILLAECSTISEDFSNINPENLSDFAVEIRYPAYEYNPSLKEANKHKEIVEEIKTFVLKEIKF